MIARLFLALSALVWLPYGLYCLAQPGSLAEAAGVAASTPTGTTELRAMYGGLQAGLGLLALLGALQPGLRRPALLALAFLGAGLFLTRALGAAVDGGVSGYTVFALGFELVTAGGAGALLRHGPERGPRDPTRAGGAAGPGSA
jgi:hypothetical protein